MTTTARQDPTRFLYLERQFCALCRADGIPGVRVVDVADAATLSVRSYRAKRRRRALAHLKANHPAVYREVTGWSSANRGEAK